MPRRAPTLCRHAGCRHLVPARGGYCEMHAHHARERHRTYNTERAETDRWYGTARWKRLRAAHLLRSPLCVECKRQHRIQAAEVVDHIVPVKRAPHRFFDQTNLRSLCRRHHAEIGERVTRG